MTNEFVSFKTSMNIEEFMDSLKSIKSRSELEYLNQNLVDSGILGVSDSRFVCPNTLCFLEKPPSNSVLKLFKQNIIITSVEVEELFEQNIIIKTEDPRALFIDLIDMWDKKDKFSHFTSTTKVEYGVNPEAQINEDALIEKGVSVGAGSIIAAGAVIKKGTVIGKNCIIRENTVVGCDGIALYKQNDARIRRFPHLAGVVIADGVEIGASSVIARGVLRSTSIGKDTVIGNLSNIGHTVKIGEKVWISVGSHIGGNTVIADNATLGLGVNIKDNITVGQSASVGMGSVVVRNVGQGQSVFGNPAKEFRQLKTGPSR